MKKEYRTPTMKVRKIQCSHMLCGSDGPFFKITNGSANEGQGAWSKDEYEDEIGW